MPIRSIAALAIAYLIAGKLGLKLAIVASTIARSWFAQCRSVERLRPGLVVTSRYFPGELAQKLDDDAIPSRLAGMCQIVENHAR